ncbi:MAG TPA: hypothetical protein VKU85_16820 [bacterium]|nr:hypothetical protein [bacterium]
MEVFLAVGIFILAVALLSLGSVVFRRPLRSSCGGLAGSMGDEADGTCSVCGRTYEDCPEKDQDPSGDPGSERIFPRKARSRTR